MDKKSKKSNDNQPLSQRKSDSDNKNAAANDDSNNWIDDEEIQTKKEYEEAFQIFDKDKSGYLSAKDLKVVLRALGQNPSDEQFHDILGKTDKDNTGKIDLHEFINFIRSQTEKFSARKELTECFSLFTDDPNGIIDRKMFFSILNAPGVQFSRSELNNVNSKFSDINTIEDYVNIILNEPFNIKKD